MTRALAVAIRTTPSTKGTLASRARETSLAKAPSAVTWGRARVCDRTTSFVMGASAGSMVTGGCARRTAWFSPRTPDLSFVESAVSLRDDELTFADVSVRRVDSAVGTIDSSLSILSSTSPKVTVPVRRLTVARPIFTAAVRMLRFDLRLSTAVSCGPVGCATLLSSPESLVLLVLFDLRFSIAALLPHSLQAKTTVTGLPTLTTGVQVSV